ncbi:slowpoke-binding protein isoform X2 [Lutzomyia longipalpis]|uniref:slowpoke-binding protein isoform X2 n=1 Tax=Lutzomyia longipalpis TaxID=7200 RepID=UPI0024846161|nr:slowpoke-binding protein isoform X2 [Lutzomyia longipalpis]
MQDTTSNTNQARSVTLIVCKTLSSVFKSSRKIIYRVCEVTSVKKPLKMFNLYSTMNRRNEDKEEKEIQTTGHDRFCQARPSRSTYRKKRKRNVRRAQSAAEFDSQAVFAANKRHLFRGRSVSTEQENSESEQSEKSPLVSTKLDSLAKLLFSKSSKQDNPSGSKVTESPTRHSVLRYQYTALESGTCGQDRSPRERAVREQALAASQAWIQQSGGRYEVIVHLDDIGSRTNKHWFLLKDTSVRTDRLMTLLPIPPDCVALEELPPSQCLKGVFMELLGSLQHPYIYPVLDLGFVNFESRNYACLVTPFNPRGSLKDLIYKSQWNEAWCRKYTRKSTCLPISQVQRLGRQILEALLFLRERGFSSHGHLHSGNVILQNGVARLSGLENGILGLNSNINAIVWSKSRNELDNIDVICFGHLLFEMCCGYELAMPQPSPGHIQLDLERYPQVAEVLQMIFDSPDGRYPSVEDLVMHDLFRNIDLRELRGTCVPSFKHGLSSSTMSILQAVHRRQGSFFSGSYSEGSSPCTPPSTPRLGRKLEDSDTPSLSSHSEEIMEGVTIAATHYEPMDSPLHFCESSTSGQRDLEDAEEGCSTSQNYSTPNQLTTTSASKNSQSRRMEYSMRGMKLDVSNPSQDSAFGSMTDGDISVASSSFRLNSFQSVTSPIDEGVEDLTESKEARDPPQKHPPSCLEPPLLLVNDQCSIYTTSPLRRGDTIEVFSQKYRVSSFEDVPRTCQNLKRDKYAFRSFEEERRIDLAFAPITKSASTASAGKNQLSLSKSSLVRNEKFKRLTHAAFSSRMAGSRHVLWKNSIMARKQTVKSNESLLDTSPTRSLETKVSPVRDLGESLAPWNSWKSRSERTLFSLADFKQPALETSSCHAEDFTSDEEDTSTRVASSGDSSNTSKPPEEPEKSLDSSDEVEDADESSDFLSSPSHEYMCKLIGSGGEETPLLEGMEMSPISPKE